MSLLLALPLALALHATAPSSRAHSDAGEGCREALAATAAVRDAAALAGDAGHILGKLEAALRGRPGSALREAAFGLATAVGEGDAARLARADTAFRALLEAHCAAAARPTLPLATLADRKAIRAVFERPEFRRARADTAGLQRVLAGLWARILELVGSAEAERYASIGRMVFILAGLAAALAGLAALRRRRPAAPGIRGRLLVEAGALPPPDQSAALAEAALARGDLTGTVRHAFLSALAALEEAGRLPRDRTLTNRELTGRLAAAGGPVAEEFGALGRLFDGAVYGGAPVDEPEARAGLAAAARIRDRAGGAT